MANTIQSLKSSIGEGGELCLILGNAGETNYGETWQIESNLMVYDKAKMDVYCLRYSRLGWGDVGFRFLMERQDKGISHPFDFLIEASRIPSNMRIKSRDAYSLYHCLEYFEKRARKLEAAKGETFGAVDTFRRMIEVTGAKVFLMWTANENGSGKNSTYGNEAEAIKWFQGQLAFVERHQAQSQSA